MKYFVLVSHFLQIDACYYMLAALNNLFVSPYKLDWYTVCCVWFNWGLVHLFDGVMQNNISCFFNCDV